MKKSWGNIILSASPFTAIALAFFAGLLGSAHSLSWRNGRVLLFTLGLVLILCAFLIPALSRKSRSISESPVTAKPAGASLVTGICILISAIIYLWFSTTGLWTQWPPNSGATMYDRLATSFMGGKLDLQIQPNPALFQLPNPYNPETSHDISIAIQYVDTSLYNGKLFYYWGPAPALLLIIPKLFIPGTINDQFLGFGFTLGLLVFQSLLILYLWRRFFYSLPEWTLVVSLLFASLAEPLLWNLNIPLIYEVAVVAGQFFFIGGIYFLVVGLDKPTFSLKRLVLAGILFSLAVGSRATMAIPVTFIFLMGVWWILFGNQGSLQPVRALAALTLPLILGAIIISWYNWARFGSPLEFGLRYQIYSVNYENYNALFLPRYVAPNLYMYLLNPPRLSKNFPFIKPIINRSLMNEYHSNYSPHIYTVEQMVGLLYIAPLAIASLISPATLLLKSLLRRGKPEKISTQGRFLNWIIVGFLGCFLLAFATILLYFWAGSRFIMDYFPTLSLITSIGIWQGYQLLSNRIVSRILYSGFIIVLVIESIGMALLLPFASPLQHFQRTNPELYSSLAHSFNLWITNLHR
jgi:hypothetical protein